MQALRATTKERRLFDGSCRVLRRLGDEVGPKADVRSGLCTSAESISLAVITPRLAFCFSTNDVACLFQASDVVIGTGRRLFAQIPYRALKHKRSRFTSASVNPAVPEVR